PSKPPKTAVRRMPIDASRSRNRFALSGVRVAFSGACNWIVGTPSSWATSSFTPKPASILANTPSGHFSTRGSPCKQYLAGGTGILPVQTAQHWQDASATQSGPHDRTATGSDSRSVSRQVGLDALGRFVAVDLEPLFLELDPAVLADRNVRGQRDHRVAWRHFRLAAGLVVLIGIADAPGPMFELFGVAAADWSVERFLAHSRRLA